jgi:hypothetical protein
MTACGRCTSDVADNLARCPCCGADAGCPNVKLARAEAAALAARASKARADANTRGADVALAEFEKALDRSLAVINVDIGFLQQLLSSEKVLYTAYRKLIDAGARTPGTPDNDQQRTAVDGLLFGSWGSEIAFAALSLDGRGLGSYGSITIELKELTISERASVLEENSWDFVRRHRIVPGDDIPAGYRAPWSERRDVGTAKLAHRIGATTTSVEHAKLVLFSDGINRDKDDFIEVHIYGPFNCNAVQRVTVLERPKDEGEQKRLENIKKMATAKGIVWNDP